MSTSLNGQTVDFQESSDSTKANELSKRTLTRSEGTGVKLFLLNSPNSSFIVWVQTTLVELGLTLNKTETKRFASLAATNYVNERRKMLPAAAKEFVKNSFSMYEKEAVEFLHY